MIWNSPDEIWVPAPKDALAAPRALFRAVLLLTTLILCIIPFIVVRYGQRLFGLRHYELIILKFWGIIAVWCFGLKMRVEGKVQIEGGVIASNHINFIDIPLLFAIVPGYMMAKSEIRGWPFIGWCARILGTEFVVRDAKATPAQVASLTARLDHGDRMVLFPEATTTDGQRVIPFRSSLFAAISQVKANGVVQPVSIFYHAPEGASRNFFGYWGEAKLSTQMWETFCSKGLKQVDVILHDPLPEEHDRKALSMAAERAVRAGFTKLKDNYEVQLQARER